MKQLVALLIGLAFTSVAWAAEDFILWNNATFTSPFDDGVIATSAEIANNNGLNAVRVLIEYADITPDVCGCNITAVLEEEISSGIWVAVAAQNQPYGVEGNGPSRVIILSPSVVINPGSDFVIEGPDGDTKISSHQGHAPDKFRVRLTMPSPGSLTSITISGYGRKFEQ